MAKEFYSEVLKGGDVIRPETIIVDDNSITWRKRNKNLITTTEVTILFGDIASISKKSKIIGADLSIKSKGGDDIDAQGFGKDSVAEILELISHPKVNESFDDSDVVAGKNYAVKIGEKYKKAKLVEIMGATTEQPEYSFLLGENNVDFTISKEKMSDVRPYLDDTTWAFKHLKDYWYDDIICISFYKANNKDFAFEITYMFNGTPKKFKQGFSTYEECVAEAFKLAEAERELLMNTNPEVYDNVPKRATFINDIAYLGESRQINEADEVKPDAKHQAEIDKAKREKESDKNKSSIEADKRAEERKREAQRIASEKEKYKLQYDKQVADLKAKQLDIKSKVDEAKSREMDKLEGKYAKLRQAKQEEKANKMANSTKEQVESVKDQYEKVFSQLGEQKKTESEAISQKYELQYQKLDKEHDKKVDELKGWLEKKKQFIDSINPIKGAKDAVTDLGKDVKQSAQNLAKEANPFA